MRWRLSQDLSGYLVVSLSAVITGWSNIQSDIMFGELADRSSIFEVSVTATVATLASILFGWFLLVKLMRRRHIGYIIIVGAIVETAALALRLSEPNTTIYWLAMSIAPIGWIILATGALSCILNSGRRHSVAAALCLTALTSACGFFAGSLGPAVFVEHSILAMIAALFLGLLVAVTGFMLRSWDDHSRNHHSSGLRWLAAAPAALATFLLSSIAINEPVRFATWPIIRDFTTLGSALTLMPPMLLSIFAAYLLCRFFSLPRLMIAVFMALPITVLALILSPTDGLVGMVFLCIGVALREGVPLFAQVQVCSRVPPEELRPMLACMFAITFVGYSLASFAPIAMFLFPADLIGFSSSFRFMMWWPEHAVYVLGILAGLIMTAVAFWFRKPRPPRKSTSSKAHGLSASDRAWAAQAGEDIRRRL